MISQTAEYALRAMVFLASEPERNHLNREIAAVTRIPQGYLAKVLLSLARAGLILSRRGRHGGFTLAHPPTGITALDVVNAVDPIKRVQSCPLGYGNHDEDLCPLHSKLNQAASMVEDTLGRCTLQQLLDQKSGASAKARSGAKR